MEQTVVNIIKQILKEAKEEGIETFGGKTRLVKLLYLLEVEYYKLHRRRLTSLEWRFFHFGPYPLEIQGILGSPEFEEEPIDLSDGKVLLKYSISFDEPVESYVEPEITRLTSRIVKRWGNADLAKLLDYVYFETEPMIDAKRGEVLDFSKIPKWEETRIKEIRVDQRKLSEIQKRLAMHVASLPKAREYIKFDRELSEILRIWDEGSAAVPLRGKCVMDIQKPKSQQD